MNRILAQKLALSWEAFNANTLYKTTLEFYVFSCTAERKKDRRFNAVDSPRIHDECWDDGKKNC